MKMKGKLLIFLIVISIVYLFIFCIYRVEKGTFGLVQNGESGEFIRFLVPVFKNLKQ